MRRKVIDVPRRSLSLGRSTAWNLAGLGTPLGLALLCVPLLVAALGTERFGLLSLMWTILARRDLSHLGLGRALTVAVAARRNDDASAHVHKIITSGGSWYSPHWVDCLRYYLRSSPKIFQVW